MNLKVMTFNVRCKDLRMRSTTEDWGKDRCARACNMISKYSPDIIGTQEGTYDQLQSLIDGLIEKYERFGIERTSPNGETVQILYKPSVLNLVEHGNFWLSETPTICSKGWDAHCHRIVTWGKFTYQTMDEPFYVFNAHLDHGGVMAQNEGTKLLLAKINEIACNQETIFLLGDFNCFRSSPVYDLLATQLVDIWRKTPIEMRIGQNIPSTWHDFQGLQYIDPEDIQPTTTDLQDGKYHIDWIFCRPSMKIMSTTVITDSIDGLYPSDHFPIQTEVQLPMNSA